MKKLIVLMVLLIISKNLFSISIDNNSPITLFLHFTKRQPEYQFSQHLNYIPPKTTINFPLIEAKGINLDGKLETFRFF